VQLDIFITTLITVCVVVCRFVVGDIQRAYNILLFESGETKMVEAVPSNPFSDVKYEIKQAETVCMFNLCALSEIGTTKNNLIAVSDTYLNKHGLKVIIVDADTEN